MKREIYRDNRGYLSPIYKDDGHIQYVEDRVSYSIQGTIRGFHGDRETVKLCTCVYGKLLLVVYDIPTKTIENKILSADNGEQVFIWPKTLNGHQCLSKECVLLYKWSKPYNLDMQYSVRYNDDKLGQFWHDIPIIASERDMSAPTLEEFLDKWYTT